MRPPVETVTSTRRLALGIAPVDALSRHAPVTPVRIDIQRGVPHEAAPVGARGHPQPAALPPGGLLRHPSGRHSLHYYPGIADHVELRLHEGGRIYVPRRLRVPLVTFTEILAREVVEAPDYLAERVRRPVLFPGADYPLTAATGLRGRVVRGDGSAVRWVHLSLGERDPVSGAVRVIGHARGDDRGEVLVILPPRAVLAGELSPTVTLELRLWGRAVEPAPPDPDTARLDPLWDLPLETVTDPDPDDPVSAGTLPPGGFVESAAPATVPFTLGRLLTARHIGDLIFSPP